MAVQWQFEATAVIKSCLGKGMAVSGLPLPFWQRQLNGSNGTYQRPVTPFFQRSQYPELEAAAGPSGHQFRFHEASFSEEELMECETEDRLNQLREAEQAVRDKYGRAAPAMMAGLPLSFEERLAALQRMAGGPAHTMMGATE
jgi:hypothetical protein